MPQRNRRCYQFSGVGAVPRRRGACRTQIEARRWTGQTVFHTGVGQIQHVRELPLLSGRLVELGRAVSKRRKKLIQKRRKDPRFARLGFQAGDFCFGFPSAKYVSDGVSFIFLGIVQWRFSLSRLS